MRFLPLLFGAAAAFYSAKDGVINASPKNWDKEVMGTKHVVLVEFYAPWCGHCQRLKPAYIEAATKLKGLAKVVAVDCDEHKSFCPQFGVQGFPTLKIFGSDKKKPPLDYMYDRTAAALVDHTVSKIPNNVESVKQGTLAAFVSKAKPKVILFSSKKTTPPLFKALAIEFDGHLHFGEVQSTETAVASQFGVKDFPAVVVIKGTDEKDFEVYDGVLKHAGLLPYFAKFAPDYKPGGSFEKPPEKVVVDATVHEVNSEDTLKSVCLSQQRVCMIAFWAYEPEFKESEAAHQENLKLLKKLNDNATYRFMWVNTVQHGSKLMRDLDVSDILPGLVAVNHNRGWFRNFRGGFDESGIKSFIEEINSGRGRAFKLPDALSLDKPKRDEL